MTYFFEEIIKAENILLVIEQHFEDEAEKAYMKDMVKDTIHHKLMDLVLDELDTEKKAIFLYEYEDPENHKVLLMEKLPNWIENFHQKLYLRAKEAEDEMLKMIEAL